MRFSTLVATALLPAFAGACAAPAPVPPPADPLLAAAADPDEPGHDEALVRWEETPWEEQCDRLRAGLRSPDPRVSLFAARTLEPRYLSLGEIRAQMGILIARAREVFRWAGAEDGEDCPDGLLSVGSCDVLALYRAAVEHPPRPDPSAEADWSGLRDAPPDCLHRVTLQEHIPALAALLERARGDAYERILWNLKLLADNTDRDREAVEDALLDSLAREIARAEGRSLPWMRGPRRPRATSAGPAQGLLDLCTAPWPREEDPVRGYRHLPWAWVERGLRNLGPEIEKDPVFAAVRRSFEQQGMVLVPREVAWVAVPAESARFLASRLADAPPPADDEEWRRVESLLPRLEVAAPDAVDALLRRWSEPADGPRRTAILGLRMRRGHDDCVPGLLTAWPGMGAPVALGRVRDPRVREFLEARVAGAGRDAGEATGALAAWHGLPEALATLLGPAGSGAGDGAVRIRRLVLEGKPEEAVLAIAEEGEELGRAIGRLGLLGQKARPLLDRYRRERHRGLYWPATAGLAIAGDAAARAEFLAFLREDRIGVHDAQCDAVGFTLNGDPEALAHWRSRVGSNCCLWFHAESVLRPWFPTMPPGENRVGDPEGMEFLTRLWWELQEGRFRWSRLADGWVPVAE